MKKLFLAAIIAVSAATITSCGPSVPSVEVKTEIDSMTYAMGVSEGNMVKGYQLERMGVDSATVDDFIKGLLEGVNAGDDSCMRAYLVGYQIGMNMGQNFVENVNFQAFGQDSTRTVTLDHFIAGFVSSLKGEDCLMNADSANIIAQEKMQKFQDEKIIAQYADNKKASEDFLAENQKNDSVVVLPSGIQYKVLKAGKGPKVAKGQEFTVHYEGRLIDGTVFDSSYKRNTPAKFTQGGRIIKGWSEIVTHMPVGSTWEVYIPQELGYGKQDKGTIKPFSTLIFKMELISVEKMKDAKKN